MSLNNPQLLKEIIADAIADAESMQRHIECIRSCARDLSKYSIADSMVGTWNHVETAKEKLKMTLECMT
jgi:hypothetical protein